MERKKAFVTGGSRGIGRGIAKVLAENGYDVAITYNTKEDEAKTLCDEVNALGGKCYFYQASMEKPDVPEVVTAKAIADLGGIDLLVCNAGLTRHTTLLEMDIDLIDFVYGLNYRSYLLCSKAAANHMVKNDVKGNIIYISSTRSIRAYETDSIYGSLKAALNRAVESFALEMSNYGIRVNCVAPGATATRGEMTPENLAKGYVCPKIPLKRKGSPEEVGHLVEFLASEKAAYITGDTIKIDGGLILPGMSEREHIFNEKGY